MVTTPHPDPLPQGGIHGRAVEGVHGLLEGGEDFGGEGGDGFVVGVDVEVGLLVGGEAFGAEGAEAVGGVVAEHGAGFVGQGGAEAVGGFVGVDVQPDDEAAAQQGGAGEGVDEGAASQGDDLAGAAGEFQDGGLLEAAEDGLALVGEEPGDGAAGAAFDLGVGVLGFPAEATGRGRWRRWTCRRR